ncbi:MAG: hypothetical protein A2664_00795 [Candidatus Taylorbacteria bacterium RIFCSPHIGHO2_01_FULL_46_22b]|uniref:dTDP-4-dehydrorhamnose reductase n=1 Tax=Candidatus Taylorbacteria bacterium RIFCSPHIGHO2_01_FULL_46_22b TaxID=1802301 RepID=A0A1G2M3I2_9BACT|nr:MAG: hypothetical protein A2664_00795 [Candidatus Taylorbacteria bacterium RIFCSPHIGHO2_01_FULL_46_22b]
MTNPPRKILVLGNGWIGTEIAKFFSAQTSDMHLETGSELPESLWKGVNVVINAIAKTNIDWCENHKQEALQSNAIVATELAKQCQKRNITYVFISSACIFESKNTRDIKYEDSEPKPRCFYSETKVLAEKLIQEAYPQTLIVRIRLPLSETPHPRNTVTKIRSYEVLSNQQESVTVIEDMLPALKKLIDKRAQGIFHLINKGTVSPAQIGKSLKHSFKICSKKELDETLCKANRARRVTVFASSKKTSLLPDIKKRLPEIAKKYLSLA